MPIYGGIVEKISGSLCSPGSSSFLATVLIQTTWFSPISIIRKKFNSPAPVPIQGVDKSIKLVGRQVKSHNHIRTYCRFFLQLANRRRKVKWRGRRRTARVQVLLYWMKFCHSGKVHCWLLWSWLLEGTMKQSVRGLPSVFHPTLLKLQSWPSSLRRGPQPDTLIWNRFLRNSIEGRGFL